jgi:hypothetical protein
VELAAPFRKGQAGYFQIPYGPVSGPTAVLLDDLLFQEVIN